MNLSLLLSGNLGYVCLQSIIDRYTIKCVFTDRGSQAIIDLCEEYGLMYFVGNPRGGRAAAALVDAKCEVLLSINYLFIVEEDILALASQYAINFHGSLLPKYRGRTPHVWAIINGETVAGVTAHLMEREMDAGSVVAQHPVNIGADMTGAELLDRYTQIYPVLINRILNDIVHDKVELNRQDNSKATYFPKRSPEDGTIDWSWSKERVRNWIRAQAPPYPGAFGYLAGEQILFSRADIDSHGFNYTDENGLILDRTDKGITVKLSNGALLLQPVDRAILLRVIVGSKLS